MTETPAIYGRNSMARSDMIVSAHREIDRLEADRAEINEQINDILKRKVKGELGMGIREFNAARQLLKRDKPGRDHFFDVCHEVFNALGAGGQLDWLDAVAKAGDSEPAQPMMVRGSASLDGHGGNLEV